MTFNADLEGVEDLLKLLDKKTFNKVVNRTANDEGRRFNTHVAKNVRAEYNIKSSEIKSVVKIRKAGGEENSFSITISSPRLDLAKFISSVKTKRVRIKRRGRSYRATRKVVRVKVKRGKAKELKGAFYVHGGLFKRKGESRMPIKKLSTLSITDMFREDIVEDGFRLIEKSYPRTLERNLNYYLKKK
jgi:hypothetical protein